MDFSVFLVESEYLFFMGKPAFIVKGRILKSIEPPLEYCWQVSHLNYGAIPNRNEVTARYVSVEEAYLAMKSNLSNYRSIGLLNPMY